MALSEKLRHSIFRKLSPLIGEEETVAVLSNFPSRDTDEPATQDHLHLEVTLVRSDLTIGLAEVRTEIAEVRTEIAQAKAEIAQAKAEIHQNLNRGFIALVTLQLTIAGVLLAVLLNQS